MTNYIVNNNLEQPLLKEETSPGKQEPCKNIKNHQKHRNCCGEYQTKTFITYSTKEAISMQ